MFIRVNRLEIQSVTLVLSTQLGELLPLSPSLWLKSPFPPPTPSPSLNKYIWGSGPQTYKHLPQSPFTGQCF